MLPGYVRSLEGYWIWLEQQIDSSGGWLSNDVLVVEPIPDSEFPDDWRQLLIDRHRLHFHDGSYLEFHLALDYDLAPIDYSFHYARADDTLVWRYDKHVGHEEDDGGDTHVHVGSDEFRRKCDEVDLGDVADLIRHDQAQ